MALADRELQSASKRTPLGRVKPRIAPPTPARSHWREFRDIAAKLGIMLFPWQEYAGRFLTALGHEDRLLYPEVAIIVGRQNGKTTLLLPLIVSRLLAGQRVMHTAQNRELPREIHDQLAALITEHYPEMLPRRRGILYGAGMEAIHLRGGGTYRIVAPTRGGARGPSNDLVIVDELREMVNHDFIAAAEPSLSASRNPQMVYLSNAGTEDSDVLNAIKKRAGADPALAYLEWSADPERAMDDMAGWLEANPAIGHMPGKYDYLRRKFESYRMANTLEIWETEHLCRWVSTMAQRIVAQADWDDAKGETGEPLRPTMGINMDLSGTRASAVVAWRMSNANIALRVVADVTGDPIDVDRLGPELRDLSVRLKVGDVVFDPYTDADLARYFRKASPMNGIAYANASQRFAQLVETGRLIHEGRDELDTDLRWTGQRPLGRGWIAIKTHDDHPVTGVLAAIRAAWAPSESNVAIPRIY